LAQDQLTAFERLTAHWPEQARPKAAIYDGDTSSYFRQKIRKNLPNVLLSNPEMLHLSLLPFHENWAEFWAGLDFVVIDEVHTYRGLLGSHMAQLFNRMQRVASHYGSNPSFVMCSATIGNPGELAQNLTGLSSGNCEIITESGAPKGKRNFIFLNPEGSPARTAILLLQSALARNLRTIVYCQSRRMTELISLWAKEKAGPYKNKISAYRAGFLPEERREIESRMEKGDLLAVITTSALELGIDIGGLDLCILVGYPGTVMSFLQRGGRVGRQGQESAVLFCGSRRCAGSILYSQPQQLF
jgi:Distinct helicase family with a unique C-terminal domain including a metal-binding cysteine cluster